ncbi:uncharacterized protein TNCT_353571, partial [Trichonephila clavata]
KDDSYSHKIIRPKLYGNGSSQDFSRFFGKVRSHLSVGTRIELQGFNRIDHIVVVECIRTDTGFKFNLDFETPDEEDGRAFMCKYASEENGWSITPEAWLDMVMYPFIRQFPILRVYTPQTSVHIWTKRADDERLCCPEHFSTVAYLQMKRLRNPRTEGKRIFTSLMDLPPILHLIQPHSLEAILELFQHHLEQSVPDLRRFNQHQACLPNLCLKFVQLIRKRFPSPGDASGIQLTCRVTKSDTQGTLDSKHLKSQEERDDAFHVDALLLGELHCFSTQTQVFELATRHGYSTVFTRGYTGQELLQRLSDACLLTRGLPYNKGRTLNGTYKYLNTCTFIVVPDNKVVYRTSAKHWLGVLRRLDAERVLAFSDIRAIFQKCGIVAYFFNWMRVVQEQLPLQNSVQMKNIMTILKYQCRTGRPLPLTRDGLAKILNDLPWKF